LQAHADQVSEQQAFAEVTSRLHNALPVSAVVTDSNGQTVRKIKLTVPNVGPYCANNDSYVPLSELCAAVNELR